MADPMQWLRDQMAGPNVKLQTACRNLAGSVQYAGLDMDAAVHQLVQFSDGGLSRVGAENMLTAALDELVGRSPMLMAEWKPPREWTEEG